MMDEASVDSSEPRRETTITARAVEVDELHGAEIHANGPSDPIFGDRRPFNSKPAFIPSPDDIKEACRQFRMGWKPGEKYRRLLGQWDEVDQ